MSAFAPISSASPPGPDSPGGVAEGPFLTQSRHIESFKIAQFRRKRSANVQTGWASCPHGIGIDTAKLNSLDFVLKLVQPSDGRWHHDFVPKSVHQGMYRTPACTMAGNDCL